MAKIEIEARDLLELHELVAPKGYKLFRDASDEERDREAFTSFMLGRY